METLAPKAHGHRVAQTGHCSPAPNAIDGAAATCLQRMPILAVIGLTCGIRGAPQQSRKGKPPPRQRSQLPAKRRWALCPDPKKRPPCAPTNGGKSVFRGSPSRRPKHGKSFIAACTGTDETVLILITNSNTTVILVPLRHPWPQDVK